MPKVNVLNEQAQSVGEIELADDVFAATIKPHLHWEVVRNQLANRRAGTHSTKTRTTVSGTTKKAVRQKGTGGARHGSRKSPVYVGGGVAHGPHPRDYSYVVPKQVRRAALCSAISTRFSGGDMLVIEDPSFEKARTSRAAKALNALGAHKALVVTGVENENLHLSVRNLRSAKYIRAEGLNVFDVLKYDKLVLTVEGARALEVRLQG
jgi:large subunit ribosomal protein L4